MPKIIPIRDLKNTSELSVMCHDENEPIYVTKNGYGDMVIMSMETYEKSMFLLDVCIKLEEAENSVKNGDVYDMWEVLDRIKDKYGLQNGSNQRSNSRT